MTGCQTVPSHLSPVLFLQTPFGGKAKFQHWRPLAFEFKMYFYKSFLAELCQRLSWIHMRSLPFPEPNDEVSKVHFQNSSTSLSSFLPFGYSHFSFPSFEQNPPSVCLLLQHLRSGSFLLCSLVQNLCDPSLETFALKALLSWWMALIRETHEW